MLLFCSCCVLFVVVCEFHVIVFLFVGVYQSFVVVGWSCFVVV